MDAQAKPVAPSGLSSGISDSDAQSFRDHIPTVDERGKRKWIYPRRPKGRFYTWRTRFSWLLLLILVVGPWLKISGNPLLMMNIPARRFSILGQIFWPQDMYLLVLMLLIGMVMIVLFTAVYGRVWCGWLCPQTVLMEMVFRKIEYAIEGDASAQRRLHKAPWTASKILKKGFKLGVFLALSFVVSNLLLAYVIGGDGLVELITDNPRNHVKGLTAMILFTLLFFGIFARFREQACTFICPYGRFQSVLLDNSSIVISYDHVRGENRRRMRRGQDREQRRADELGDCIDCGLCIDVCPTGIDIRDGTQMECVNCTACIDACDRVMDRMSFPRGLIRYASFSSIDQGHSRHVTPRVVLYTAVLVALSGLLAFLLLSRADVQTTMLRSPGTMFQETADGRVTNLYLVKITNKTPHDISVDLRLEGLEGNVMIPGGVILAKARDLTEGVAVVTIDPELLASRSTPVRVGVYSGDQQHAILKSTFLGPRK